MALTDNCDVFGSAHEDGINDVVSNIEYKRPSLFNYASGLIAREPEDLLCERIHAAPEVTNRGNPILTEVDPVPVLGTDGSVALDFCFQITEVALDFAPENTISIPGDAGLGIEDQQFGIFIRVCAGLACPSERNFREIIDMARRWQADRKREREPFVPRPDHVHCFCLDAYTIGSLDLTPPGASTSTVSIAESPRFTVHDIAVMAAEFEEGKLPKGLRRSAECYLQFVVQFAVLPRVVEAVEQIIPMLVGMMDDLMTDVGATFAITPPTTSAIPNNPAVEDDELKLFVDMSVGVAP